MNLSFKNQNTSFEVRIREYDYAFILEVMTIFSRSVFLALEAVVALLFYAFIL